jgi:hypothetical protein
LNAAAATLAQIIGTSQGDLRLPSGPPDDLRQTTSYAALARVLHGLAQCRITHKHLG